MAGEFGHMQGCPTAIWCETAAAEAVRSGNALVRTPAVPGRLTDGPAHLSAWSGTRTLEGPQITRPPGTGPAPIELLADVGRWLGVGLAGWPRLDPGCIIIGGGSEAGEPSSTPPAMPSRGP
jgi:glucokinase